MQSHAAASVQLVRHRWPYVEVFLVVSDEDDFIGWILHATEGGLQIAP